MSSKHLAVRIRRRARRTPDGKQAVARQLSEAASGCPRCSKRALVPKSHAPDLAASRKHKPVVEIYGGKSSVKDKAKMEFYRAKGFTAVTVPNEVADNPEYSKPIFQLLGLLCGSDHPERLFIPRNRMKEIMGSSQKSCKQLTDLVYM
ncbi:MAG: hypothetical protein JRN16_02705 [Nitrososphaerota archaeon]|nr:hypothetical protein [Nitrososphaerota archaeon]MDG7027301.1 hypothetical protein [Nitrososphaerota archaeon]